MTTALDLLRLSPEDALQAMIQSMMLPGVNASMLKLSPLEAAGPTLTRIYLSVDKGAVDLKYWGYDTVHEFVYNRLDLTTTFGDLDIVVPIPKDTTRLNLIRRLFQRSDIYFDPSEFEDGPVLASDTSFILAPVNSSSRWVGEVRIALVRTVAQLKDYTPHTEFYEALKYPDANNYYPGSAKHRLIACLIEANDLEIPLPFDENDFDLTGVVKTSNLDDRCNTRATLTINNSSIYSGSVEVTYRRLSLAKASDYQHVEIDNRTAISTTDLGIDACDRLRLWSMYEDFIDESLPYIMENQTTVVSVFAAIDSPTYVSEFTINWLKGLTVDPQ